MPLRPFNREQAWLLPPTLDELKAADYPARVIDAFVNGLDAETWEELEIDLAGDRDGTRVIYRLADEGVLKFWLALRSVAESRLAEVRQIVEEFAIDGVKDSTLPRGELRELLARDEVFLIDVRPMLEYEHGHLPVPIGDVRPRALVATEQCRCVQPLSPYPTIHHQS